MKDSAIGWCHDTVNFWWGCVEQRFDDGSMRPACALCYARTYDRMRGPHFDHGRTHWGFNAPRWLRVDSALKELFANERRAKKEGVRRRQFINSMSDFFEPRRDLDEARLLAFDAFRRGEHLDILLLTKRPGSIVTLLERAYNHAIDLELELLEVWLRAWIDGDPPRHIWLGTTVENQKAAAAEIPKLLSVPAWLRFVSCEPLLGSINLTGPFEGPLAFPLGGGINWVIAGGESGGSRRREMDMLAATKMADVCAAWEVPFFMKQDSGLLPGQQGRIPDELWARKEFPIAA